MKIVFFGTPEFSAIILEALINSNYPPVLVITSTDKPVGKKQVLTPPPAKIFAQKHKIPIWQPERIENEELRIKDLTPDLIVVAAFGPPFLTKEILEIPKYGCLNVHPSLLPKYRGASPIPYAILQGEKETGVTIIKMSEKVDQGGIVAQESMAILPEDTTPSLTKKLAELGGDLLVKTIPLWVEGKIQPKLQGQSPTPYCYRLKKEDGKIDWTKPAEILEKEIRAFYPWPGSYTIWEVEKDKSFSSPFAAAREVEKDKSFSSPFATARENRGKLIKIKILKARTFKSPDKIKYPIGKVLVVPQNEIGWRRGLRPLLRLPESQRRVEKNECSSIRFHKWNLGVQCKKDFLVIEELQMEGKKEMGAEDFLRGHSSFIGTILTP